MDKKTKINIIMSVGRKNATSIIRAKHPDIYEEINVLFPQLSNYPFTQKLFWYINDYTDFPICEVCGKPITRNINNWQTGYEYNTCSHACSTKHPKRKEKMEQKCMTLHGVKSINTLESKKEKTKKTWVDKYGVDHPWKIEKIYEKSKKTCKKKYGSDSCNGLEWKKQKTKKTWVDKYGVDNPMKNEKIKHKQSETCLEHWGVRSPIQNKEIFEKIKQTNIKKYGVEYPAQLNEIQTKMYLSRKKNKTNGKSKQEDRAFDLLQENFKIVYRHHKSEKYPFNCDFYIPEKDLYIEMHLSWVHGGCEYIGLVEQENKILKWKKKSTELNFKGRAKKYYLNAIETWTKRDVEKKKIAEQNRLNYICFYEWEKFIDWLNKNI